MHAQYKMRGERIIEITGNHEIIKITKDSLSYPNLLKEINGKPKELYVLGNLELLRRKCMAIVGCRECSSYGAEVSQKLAYNLAKQNIVIVSGLAKGIDTYAHQGALEGKGKTIAVVAHGLDMIYPKENRELAKQIILNDGAIISEFPIGTKTAKENFPMRNRIISGISTGTIVVEAKEKSGSLITANFALEQGRELYAVPGNIISENSRGTNELIKNGAEPIISYESFYKI